MKKLLLLSLFLIAIAGLASATPVSCGVLMAPNSSSILLNSTCTVNPDPGYFISTLTLTAKDDYTGGTGNPTVDYAGTLFQDTVVYDTPTFCTVTTIGGVRNPCDVTINPASTVTGLNLSTYSVNLDTASNVVSGTAGDSISGASIQLFLDYAETLSPTDTAPEPATLGLMGSALLGLGLAARKMKK